MQLTPEQLEQVRQAKERGDRRVSLSYTQEQSKAWRDALQQELANQQENVAQFHKINSAAEQPGFLGDIRRAILLSRRPVGDLAAAMGVDPQLLSDFRAGEAELPGSALNRLITSLGLRLMQEIPR